MATRPRPDLLETMRSVFIRRELVGVPDAQLLTRFIQQREGVAFEAIMRRHGAMVFAVCQRILGDIHEAEDAYQATFLVLNLKAKGIVPRERLAGWLHGVAQRTALKNRTARARWQARGQRAMARTSRSMEEELERRDLHAILDQELAALNDKYRLPIILCDLEGKSRKEAADQLGWKEGTLSGRLARGRRLLASRLTGRGVELPVLGLAAFFAPKTMAAGPSVTLLAATVKAAQLGVAGQALAAGIISPQVAALTQGVLKTMLLTKLKTISGLLLAVSLLTAGTGFVAYKSMAAGQVAGQGSEPGQIASQAKDKKPKERTREEIEAEQKYAEARLKQAEAMFKEAKAAYEYAKYKRVMAQAMFDQTKAQAPLPSPTIKGTLVIHRGLELATYDHGANKWTALSQPDAKYLMNYQALSARLGPDGRTLAFGQAEEGRPPSKIQIRDVHNNDPPQVIVDMLGRELSSWSWSPDGKQLSFAVWDGKDKKYHPYLVDIATKKSRKVVLPPLPFTSTKVLLVAPGLLDAEQRKTLGLGTGDFVAGDHFTYYEINERIPLNQNGRLGASAEICAWSADGLWLVHYLGCFHLVNANTIGKYPRLLDRQLVAEPNGFMAGTCRFSPDGKKALYIGINEKKEYYLTVIDLLLGQTKVLAKLPNQWDFAACWSPDSRQILCSSTQVNAEFRRSGPSRVMIYDAAGKSEPRLLLEEREDLLTVTDWR